MTSRFSVAFLDEDHVITMVRLGMGQPNDADRQAIRTFFAPEDFDPAELYGLGSGLRPEHGVTVVRAKGDPAALAGAEAILFRRGKIDASVIASCNELKLVQRLGERSNSIDLDALRARGIPASCLHRRSLAYTAEHAILLSLALSKRLPAAERALRDGAYDPAKIAPPDKVAYNWVGLDGVGGLHGRTFGIVGLGEVGAIVARIAAGFGMRVIYTNRTPMAPEREAAMNASFRPLDALMAEADIVSVHAPNTPQTRGLIGAAQIARMKPGAFLVNTARGPLVDEDALFEALSDNRIAGAGLDVHETEPRPATDRFCTLANVILTPHLAGGSRRGLLAEAAMIYDNLRAARSGQPPPHDRVA